MNGYAFSKILAVSEIKIPADSDAVNRGYGAFDFFGVVNGKAFYLERHIERFFNTMRLMRLRIDETPAKVKQIIEEVIIKNRLKDFHIKLFTYPKESFLGDKIDGNLFVIPLIMPPATNFDFDNGIKIITKEYQRFLPEAKTTNYLPMVYWYNEITAAGAVDVVYYSNEHIRESSRGNVFIVKDEEVRTPHEEVLKGITRSVTLDILRDQKISIKEEPLTLSDFYEADEIFLTSTTKKILPVIKADEKLIGKGKVGQISLLLKDKFARIQENWNS